MLELFQHAGWVAYPLGVYSVLALAIILERLHTLGRLRRLEERAFRALLPALERGEDAMLRDPQISAAPVAQVLDSLSELRGASDEAIQHAADIALSMQRNRFRRYLGTLATIGSTSPYIGLFGTVLGVMTAFQAMSRSGMGGEMMAAGISEALSATALGLLVAVPSVMGYNYHVGRVNALALLVHGHAARLAPLLRRGPLPHEERAVPAHEPQEV